MRPTDLRTPLLGLVIWVAMLAVSLLAWSGLWLLVRRALADIDPVVAATYAAPFGAALAGIGLVMAARTLVLGAPAARRAARVRPHAPRRH